MKRRLLSIGLAALCGMGALAFSAATTAAQGGPPAGHGPLFDCYLYAPGAYPFLVPAPEVPNFVRAGWTCRPYHPSR